MKPQTQTRALDVDGLTVVADLVPNEHGRMIVERLEVSGGRITSDVLRKIQVGVIEASVTLQGDPADLETLSRREATESPQDFYSRVARAYGAAASTSSRPGKVIAERSGIPLTTVHRWIYQARLRGYLPDGERGKAG